MSLASRKLIQATAGATTVDTGDDDFANVVLLLDGDGTSDDDNNTFTDSGSVGATITENGDVVQGSFSPYGDNWSVYFESDTAFMQSNTAISVQSNNFTIEMWVWATETDVRFCSQNNTGGTNFYFGTNSTGKLRWDVPTGTSVVSSVSSGGIMEYVMPLNQWVHVAAVREGTGSQQFKMYADGVLVARGQDNSDHGTGREINIAGGRGNSANYDGYISNFRFVVGSAVYTSAFTPPTTPLTNITNTKLLACQSNRFIDNSSIGDTFTLNLDSGLPKVTPFSPFKDDDARDITTDGGSALFGPSGDYLQLPSNSAYNATSSLCVECWFYMVGAPSSGPSAHCPMSRWQSTTLGQRSWFFDIENTGVRMRVDTATNGANVVVADDSTGALNRYAWYHIALTWDGSTYRGFLNGELIGSLSDSAAPRGTSQNIRIGYNLNTHYMDGYVSDCRVLVDQGPVYTAAFTPPTAPLGNLTGTANTLTLVEYENKSFSVNSQDTNPQGVRFKSDGTKMYVVGNTGDDVGQYSLSTAWDVSTASFDSVTLDVSSEDTTPNGLAFSSDGTKLYITGNANDKIFQYDLSTAWDLSTANYASKSLSVQGSSPIEPFIHPSGTSIYNIDSSSETVYQYTMTTAFDLSTASYASKSINVNSQESIPTSLVFSSDGTKMFVAGQSGDDINQYTLSTAWDVSTASFDNLVFDSSSQAANPSGIDLKPDGTKLYMISNSTDTVYQYSLNSTATPPVLLNFQDAGIYDRSGINNIDTVGDARLGFAPIYGTGSLEFDGTGDYFSMPVEPHFDFGTADFTIEAWVNLSATGQFNPIVYLGRDTHTGIVCDVSSSNNPRIIADIGASWTTVATGSTALEKNRWYHLAFVRNGSSFKIYVDGVEDASATNSGSITAATSDSNSVAQIGYLRTDGGADRYFYGYLDDLRITNGVARYTSAFTPPDEIDLSTDTHREYVTLFLDGDGTVNGQNNTFTDSSTNDFTVTESGSVVQGVFSPYGDNWSNNFNSADERIDFTPSFSLGSNDFTIEMWVNPSAASASSLESFFWLENSTTDFLVFRINNNNDEGLEFRVYDGSNKVFLTQGSDYLENGEWVHVAATKSGSTYNFFVNGTSVGTATYSTALPSYTDGHIGAWTSVSQDYEGYISNVRVINGTALYTSNFTPPTSYLTAVTNTVLLTCQSNRFVDSASSPHTLTLGGTPSVSRFSPFESNKPYDITTDGGSGYFDGVKTTQLYAGTSNVIPATGDFTIEGWVYFTGVNNNSATNGSSFFMKESGASNSGDRCWQSIFNSNGTNYDDISIVAFSNNSTFDVGTFTHTFYEGQWYHIAITRTGTTYEVFVNGTSIGTDTLTVSSINQSTTENNWIGSWNSSNKDHTHIGYFGDFRIVHSRVYTSDFTPPTSPLTAIANTELLLNFQDSAIPDLSGINNIDTVGNAKVAGTDPTKYGSNSIQFDGTGDYLTFDAQLNELSFGTGDFTIEGWFYIQSGDEYPYALDFRSSASQAAPALYFYNYGNGSIDYYVSGASRILGTSAGNDVWQHIAVCRSGTSTKMFVNGTQSGSTYTDSTDYAAYSGNIGIKYDNVRPFKGFMDDIRITKGVARYTANFTPPTQALPKF